VYSPMTSFPGAECRACQDSAFVECGGCGRWYCGPCSRARTGGVTTCLQCHPAVERTSAEGEDP
jgi:hypothetical protein